VHVAELPLPPAITEGLHVSEVGVCAQALHGSSTAAMSPMATAGPNRGIAFCDRTSASLVIALRDPPGAPLRARVQFASHRATL
jgi:hypothetical protein